MSPKFVPYALSNADLTPYAPKVSGGIYDATADYSCLTELTQYIPRSEGNKPATIARISAFIGSATVGIRGIIISASNNVNVYDNDNYLLAKVEQQTAIQARIQTFAMSFNPYTDQDIPIYVWVKAAAAGSIRAYSSLELLRY